MRRGTLVTKPATIPNKPAFGVPTKMTDGLTRRSIRTQATRARRSEKGLGSRAISTTCGEMFAVALKEERCGPLELTT